MPQKDMIKFKGENYSKLSPIKAMLYLQSKKLVMGKSVMSIWFFSAIIGVSLYALDLYYGISSAKDYKSGWINRFILGFALLRVMTSGYVAQAISEDKTSGKRTFIRFLGVNSIHYILSTVVFEFFWTGLIYGLTFFIAIMMTSSSVDHIDI